MQMKLTANQKIQISLRNKFLKKGVKMISPETIFFSKDTSIGKNVTIEPYVVILEKVSIKNNVRICSFSHLENVKVENNVGINSKINHLSYVGDTSVGKSVNIGAGTITCNYDGIKKSKTTIKDKVFVGSNSSLVAPVVLNKGSVIGAGSVITKNVNKNSLALTRSSQKEKKNYRSKK